MLTPREVTRILGHLTVVESTIAFTDPAVAREAVALFDEMNRHWWASPTEAFIYNEFADALREAFRLGLIDESDLLTEDDLVLAKLDAAAIPSIAEKLALIRHFNPTYIVGYSPRVIPKERWLDPPVVVDGAIRRCRSWALAVPAGPRNPRCVSRLWPSPLKRTGGTCKMAIAWFHVHC